MKDFDVDLEKENANVKTRKIQQEHKSRLCRNRDISFGIKERERNFSFFSISPSPDKMR